MFCETAIDSCLLVVDTAMTFAAARDHCQNMNMDLAVIETAAEANFAADILVHLGGTLAYV